MNSRIDGMIGIIASACSLYIQSHLLSTGMAIFFFFLFWKVVFYFRASSCQSLMYIAYISQVIIITLEF